MKGFRRAAGSSLSLALPVPGWSGPWGHWAEPSKEQPFIVDFQGSLLSPNVEARVVEKAAGWADLGSSPSFSTDSVRP